MYLLVVTALFFLIERDLAVDRGDHFVRSNGIYDRETKIKGVGYDMEVAGLGYKGVVIEDDSLILTFDLQGLDAVVGDFVGVVGYFLLNQRDLTGDDIEAVLQDLDDGLAIDRGANASVLQLFHHNALVKAITADGDLLQMLEKLKLIVLFVIDSGLET